MIIDIITTGREFRDVCRTLLGLGLNWIGLVWCDIDVDWFGLDI